MSIITSELLKDIKGNIVAQKSSYRPSGREKKAIAMIMNNYRIAWDLRNKKYREFNDYTLLQRQSIDQRTFNAWQEDYNEDIDENWKSNAVRPIVRNRIISIAAHITGTLISPIVTAQNDNDEEDKNAARVMKDIMDWRNNMAKYERTFLYSIIGALVNPAVILHTEFCKVEREIKELGINENKWTKKKILDEVLSGFKDSIVPVDELFIGNFYEHDIQKQPFLIWRKFIEYNDAAVKYYGKYKNFAHVRPGVHALYSEEDSTFYEQKDEELEDRLVEEINYYDRYNDLHLIVVNGVLLTDPERPIQRLDKKYPFVKTGYELIDEGKFFYYRSLANKLKPDEEVINTLYRMIIDGTFLQLMPPIAVFGEDQIGASVVRPGTVTPFDRETKIEKIDVGSNINQGLQTLNKVEQSISESSNDLLQSGVATRGTQTAFEVSRLEQNARIMLGMFAKMVGFMVQDLGELIISDILQYMTVSEIMDLSDGKSSMVFRKFLINKGKKSRRIEFTNELEEKPTKEQALNDSLKVMEEEDQSDNPNQEIYKVNPTVFRKRKFSILVSSDFRTPPTENLKRALNIEAYDRAVKNPLANQEEIFRDLLLGSYDTTQDDPEKYIKKQQQNGIGDVLKGGGSESNISLANMASMAQQAGVQVGE